MPSFTLQSVNRLRDACFSAWRLSNDSVEEHPMTLADYKALALPGAGAPVNPTGDPGAIWLQAGSRAVFDTPTGQLAPGDVAEWTHGQDFCNGPGDTVMVIGMPDGRQLNVRQADVVRGSRQNLAILTLSNTRRAGVTVVDGVLNVETVSASHA